MNVLERNMQMVIDGQQRMYAILEWMMMAVLAAGAPLPATSIHALGMASPNPAAGPAIASHVDDLVSCGDTPTHERFPKERKNATFENIQQIYITYESMGKSRWHNNIQPTQNRIGT
ncbi:hypothetical protein ACOSQ2_021106 [Xanthoceras sorbifolium]